MIGIPRKAAKVIAVQWQKLLVKVNTNGSFSSDVGRSGASRVFRNTTGFTLGCFAFPTASVLAFVAELQAVIFAILTTWDKSWHRL